MKIQGIDVEQTQSAKINWGQILGKGASGAKTLFEPVMPSTVNTISSTTDVLRDVRNATRALRSTARRQDSQMKNSAANKKSQNLFKSAFSDIESGSFSMDKISDDLFDDYESQSASSFKMPTGDDAVDMSSEEILLLGNKGVAQSIIQSSSAQLRGLEASSKALINANIKSTQALGISINNTLVHGFNNINTTLTIQNQKLDTINRGISGLLEFNNKNALEYYTKSIDMMAGIGKVMENFEKSMNPQSRKKGRSFDTSYGFNPKEYFDYIKEGFQESLFGTGAQMVGSAVKDKDFGLMGMLIEAVVPKAIKDPLSKFDKSLTKMMDEAFRTLGDKLNQIDAFQMLGLGDIFGSKREKINSVNLGKYMKEATPWNGMAQKALVEVIPELLTSIESKLDKGEKRYFDYDSAQWMSESQLKKDYLDDYFANFSIALRDTFDKVTEIAKSTGRNDTESLTKALEAILDDRVTGRKDAIGSNNDISSELRRYGFNKTQIRQVLDELNYGYNQGVMQNNDLSHEIGTTQHRYRNLFSQRGKEYSKDVRNMHYRHDTSGRYTTLFTFGDDNYTFGSKNVSEIIREIQNKYRLDFDVSNDRELQSTIINMIKRKAPQSEIEDHVKAMSTVASFGNKTKSRFDNSKLGQKTKSKIDEIGANIDRYGNAILDTAGDVVYLDYSVGDVSKRVARRVHNYALANKFRHRKYRNSDTTSSQTQRAVEQIDAIREDSYDDSMNKSQSELDREQMVISRGIDTITGDTTQPQIVEQSIIKSNNMLQAALGSILVGFKGFTSRLFGKEGFFKKLWDSDTRKKITGKLFTNEDAIFKKQYEGAKAGLRSLKDKTVGYLGKGYDFLYDNTMKYKYGENYKESEDYRSNTLVSETLNRNKPTEKIKQAVGTAADAVQESAENLQGSMNALVEATVGDPEKSPTEKKRAFSNDFMKRLKATAPKALAGAIAGAGIGLLNNQFSLLGSMFLPGGPIAGAIVGSGLTILSQTEAFKSFMFGKLSDPNDPSSAREGGLISKNLKDKFVKMMPFAIGGAVTGGLSAILKGALGFNSGLGILGMQILPGGILGGAILGSGLAILKNSDKFQEMLFGKKDESGNRQGAVLSNFANKSKALFSALMPGFKKAAAGLGAGALTGAVLSNAGYIPAMLSMGGPVGMGIVGLGLGIASSTEKFNEWMFGTKDPDTGERRKDGVLSRSINMLRLNVIEPIGDAFKTKMLDLVDWTKDKITYPFRLAFGPIIDSLTGIKDNVVEFVKDKFDALGNGIMEMMSKTMKSLFSPVTKLIGFVGKSIAGIASTGVKIALSPLSMGLQAMEFLTMGKRRKEYVDFAKEYYTGGGMTGALNEKWANDEKEGRSRNFFGKMSDTVGAFLGQGEASAIAKNKYADRRSAEGDNSADWMRVSLIGTERSEHRKSVKQRKADEKRWAAINKERKKIMTELGGREVTLTDSAVSDYQNRFEKLGISKNYLQSSNDIMDLVYRRDEFKQKMNPAGNSGSVFEETPAQKQARENTEKFRENILASLKQLLSAFGVDQPGTETVAETLTDIKESSEETAAASNFNAEVTAGGDYNETIKPKRGQNLKASLVKKYNAVASFLGFKKKQEDIDRENAEDEKSQAGHGKLFGKSAIDKDGNAAEGTKKKGILGQIWDKIKSVGSLVGGSKIGSFLLKGAKFAGAVGLLGGLGFTIAELIRPGTSEKIGAKIDAFNDYVNSDDFGMKKVFNDFSNWFDTTFIGEWWSGKVEPWWNETASPWLTELLKEKIPKFFSENVPTAIIGFGNFISENADTVMSAVTSVFSNIAVPIGTAIGKSTPAILAAVLEGSWAVLKSLGEELYYMLFPGKRPTKTDVSSTSKKYLESQGTNVDTRPVGSVDASSEEEAKQKASKKYGISNPVVTYNPATGKYDISQYTVSGARTAKTTTGKETNVADSNTIGTTAKLAAFGLGDLAFNMYGGRGINAVKLTQKGLTLGADVGGKILTAGGKLMSNTVGKFPGILGLPGKIGGAVSQVSGSALQALAHPVESAKSLYSKLSSKLGAKVAKEAAEEGSEKVIKETAEAATKKVAQESIIDSQKSVLVKLLEKLSGWLEKVVDSKPVRAAITGQLPNATDSILTKLSRFLVNKIDDILLNSAKCSKKLIDLATAAVAKITGKLGLAAGTLGIAEVISIGTGAIFGALDAANLFEVKEPDWIMRIVSTVMEALLASTVGAAVDFIFMALKLIGDMTGKDWNFKKELAEFLYKLMCGFSNESIDKLEASQAALNAEKDVYNALNKTNLSISAYNDEANKTVFGKFLDLFNKNKVSTATAEEVRKKLLNTTNPSTGKKYTDSDIGEMAKNGTLDDVLKSLGYGNLSRSMRSSSLYAQGNPKWANMPIGRLPNGAIATMGNAGCGPTALAAVANTVASRGIGYGPITPADMAAYASANGYISQGGANAGLFTEGANKLGLVSSAVKNPRDLRNNLLAGRPTVLTGKSSSSNDPYTKAGHIVVADGMVGDKVSVLDPISGKRKLYNMNAVSKKTKHAWAYSTGYGPSPEMWSDPVADAATTTTRTSFGSSTTNNFTTGGGRKGTTTSESEDPIADNATINDVIIESSSNSTGITNAEQLAEYAATKGIFGKLSLMGKVMSAKVSSMLNGTTFWEEFEKLTSGDSVGGSAILSGYSKTLKQMLEHPSNIKEELLAKTIERAYIGESNTNYAAVNSDSGNTISVGPYQANSKNAVALLNDVASASGLPYALSNIFSTYARKIAAQRTLSASEKAELSNALANEDYKDIITAAIDKNAMNWYYNTFYKSYFGKYYDNGTIKDLRTFPLLADIGTTGPDYIVGASRSNSFIHNWTPTTKDKEFAAAYDVLRGSKVYYKNSKYSTGYLNRIKNTYNALKGYTFKHSIAKGNMASTFASPIGFGPLDAASGFSNTIGTITDGLINQFGNLTGIDPSLLGLTSTTSSSNQSNAIGTYDNGYQLTNIAGTDVGRFIAAAKSQVGYYEKKNASDLKSFDANKGNNHYTKYAQEIGGWNGSTYGPAHWCNFFASWAGKAAGIPSSIIQRTGSCGTMRNFYKNKGLYYSADQYSGKPGDLVFFNWDGNKNYADHIGIVTGTDADNVYTIEGNTGNGTGTDVVAAKSRSRSTGTIIGFATPPWTNEYATVNPSKLLTLGYGNPKLTKIDSPAYREQMRESMKTTEEFNITPKDFEAIGFGPGMSVDAGFDMSNTDSKLDKIFGVIAEWYTESKKAGAAQSAATNNINMVKSNTTAISPSAQTSQSDVRRYKDSVVSNHVMLASKANIRNNM